jgi:hypothetical protein
MSEGIRGPGDTGAEALFTVPRLRGPEGPLYTVVRAAVCSTGSVLHGCAGGSLLPGFRSTRLCGRQFAPRVPLYTVARAAVCCPGSALHGCAGGSLLSRLSPKEWARAWAPACVPLRLKPLISWLVHRSAEALRHPKAAPPKSCATQRLRHPKADGLQNSGRRVAQVRESLLWTVTLRLPARLRSELRQNTAALGIGEFFNFRLCLPLPLACRLLRLDCRRCFLAQRVVAAPLLIGLFLARGIEPNKTQCV